LFSLSVSLYRYVDVVQALRCESLSPRSPVGDEHREFRTAAISAVCPSKLAEWTPEVTQHGSTVDLVKEIAAPWSLQIAALAVGISLPEAEYRNKWAKAIFNAAAEPFDGTLQEEAQQATLELARIFSGPDSSFHIQAFVALSQTLPCFLANTWLALLQHPIQLSKLRDNPGILPAAMEELLRYAGPSRAILRYANDDVEIGGAAILGSANRDAEQFIYPDTLDLTRKGVKHLAFGLGAHSCIGAVVVRTAATLATQEFLDQFAEAKIVEYTPNDRFGIRSLKSLQVAL
jgi:cytochrome P450